MSNPMFDRSSLRRQLDAASALQRMPAADRLFRVLGCSAREALSSRNFMVLGSNHRSEIRLLSKHANLVGVVDDSLASQRPRLFGAPVISTEEWAAYVKANPDTVSCVLVATPNGYVHFSRAIAQWDAKALWPVQFLELLRVAGVDATGETGRFFWYGYSFLESTLSDFEYLCDFADELEDEYSRITWYSILNYRLTLNPHYLMHCAVGHHTDRFSLNSYSCNKQFFEFGTSEVFVDGGAFVGDTAEQFVRAVGGQFDTIYSFEPATAHHPAIRQRMRRLRDEVSIGDGSRFVLSDRGLWSSETTLTFNPSQIVDAESQGPTNTQSAHLVDSGILNHIYPASVESAVSVQVPVTTIDAATGERATFVKLEIEGAELQALQGAMRTIQKCRPKMALSIYHKPEDLRTLTEFVVGQDLGYKFGFRQHNSLVPDAMVLYCH